MKEGRRKYCRESIKNTRGHTRGKGERGRTIRKQSQTHAYVHWGEGERQKRNSGELMINERLSVTVSERFHRSDSALVSGALPSLLSREVFLRLSLSRW